MASPRQAGATNQPQEAKAAGGRRVGICTTTFGTAALRLHDNGYLPIPLVPGTKRPVLTGWSTIPISIETVERWAVKFRFCGIGLRTGQLVGVDVDIVDPDLAHVAGALVRDRLGDTLTRVGFWPKRLLPYRTETPLPKITCGTLDGAKVEFLGIGQQFVAFGIHPDTGQPYGWVDDTPLDVPLAALPLVTSAELQSLEVEIAALLPQAPRSGRRSSRRAECAEPVVGPVRDHRGLVVDGRDGWLSTIAFHVVHDATAAGDPMDARRLAARVWERFAATTDLDRPAGHAATYSRFDAERKLADKLRLLAENRLPPREMPAVEAMYQAPVLPVTEARGRLEALLTNACDRIEAWHAEPETHAPRIGIKATVGLGKSTSARQQLLRLRQRLIAAGAPSRLLVLTPSHTLAEEAAAAWRSEDVSVAVLRGYEAVDPRSGTPMCRDVNTAMAAIDARSRCTRPSAPPATGAAASSKAARSSATAPKSPPPMSSSPRTRRSSPGSRWRLGRSRRW